MQLPKQLREAAEEAITEYYAGKFGEENLSLYQIERAFQAIKVAESNQNKEQIHENNA